MRNGRWINNERLEFLGDAILDAIVADIVFKQFEYKKEGFLTNVRSKIVQRETLNKFAIELGLDRLIKTTAKNIPSKTHMYGNALEALIGAIYLDRGYRVAKKFVYDRLINTYLNMDSVATQELNFKSRLIEWSQKHKIPVEFNLDNFDQTEENTLLFKSSISIYNMVVGRGEGTSKKESQQNAAKEVIDRINKDPEFQPLLLELKQQADSEVKNGESL